jgi:hypothetical protein
MTDLLELARRLAEECPPELGREIAATGSVGAGLADGYSDVELLFLVDERPSVEAVRTWLESVGATDVLAGEQSGGVWAWCRFGDVEVEPYWDELDRLRGEVDVVAAGETSEHARLALGYVLTHCRPLRAEGPLAELGARLAEYPDALRRRLVEDAIAGWEIPSPRLGPALRGDRFAVEGFLMNDAERVLRIVFALNRRWEPPRWKWLAYHVSTLEVAPPRLAERVVSVLLESDAVLAVARMLELVRETLSLIPDEFDVSAARKGIEARLARL